MRAVSMSAARLSVLLLAVSCSGGVDLLKPECRSAATATADDVLFASLGATASTRVRFVNPLPLPLEVTKLELTEGAGFTFRDDRRALTVPGGSCPKPGIDELELDFTATRLAPSIANLTGFMGSDPFTVTLSGAGVGPLFEAQQALSFGPVETGSTTTRNLALRNIGTVDSSLNVAIASPRAVSAGTSAEELCVGALVNGQCVATTRATVTREHALPLVLTPRTGGEKAWELTLTPDSRSATPVVVRVTARVLDTSGCQLTSSPLRLSFGLSAEERRLLSIVNAGAGPCLVTASRVEGNTAFTLLDAPAPRTVLEPGDRTQVTVVAAFGPHTALANAAVVLEATPNALRVPLGFDLGDASCLTLPTSIELPAAVAGCVSRPQSVHLANLCAKPIVLRGVSVTPPFAVSNVPVIPPAGLALQPGAPPVSIGLTLQGGADAGASAGALTIDVGQPRVVSLVGSTNARREVTDRFDLTRPPADWVFVLDDSPAFAPHHQHVRRQLDLVGESLRPRAANARLAVTTTSPGPAAGTFRALDGGARWLTSGGYAANGFLALTSLASSGSATPSCLEAAARSVTSLAGDGGTNEGFHRSNAALVFVCVTGDVEHATTPAAWRAQLLATGPATSYSVVGPFLEDCPTAGRDDGGHVATVDALGGAAVDLCLPWANAFIPTSFGAQRRFPLTAYPDLSSPLAVAFDGVPTPGQTADGGFAWRYEPFGNVLEVPLEQDVAEISIRYRLTCQ